MSSFFRLAGTTRPCPSLKKPLSARFFSTATPKRPLGFNFFKQPSPTLRKARYYSGGFGPARQYAANKFLLNGFLGVNVAVFGYSLYVTEQARAGYVDSFKKYRQIMTMNLTEFKNGAYWQPITSMFAHANVMHIAFNMFTFWSLGGMLCRLPVTPGQFTLIVLGSGLAGSLFWLGQRHMQEQAGAQPYQRALGFSGALMGAVTVVACFVPRNKVGLFGVVPVPLWLCALGYAFYDGYYLNSENTRVAHAGHLGGMAFGLAYYFLKLRRLHYPGSI
ncbi:rhomboid family protein [Stagonosporopsis vannaccii]|nr:rhomboid family protein [Stagonosporopsis vannaccii]